MLDFYCSREGLLFFLIFVISFIVIFFLYVKLNDKYFESVEFKLTRSKFGRAFGKYLSALIIAIIGSFITSMIYVGFTGDIC